ncbi:MAG TPA: aminodeoxychorismate synthase component I, partial [Blastocatellia bacterium]|nr:aminodeoxychorismate synthase component I [Blastocatellia bacterium]
HPPTDFPLAIAAIFDHPDHSSPNTQADHYQTSEWQPLVSRAEYTAAIHKIRDYIIAGHTYQVNYTFPIQCQFSGDSLNWFRDLCRAQGSGYFAYLDLGSHQILSISPELFFERQGDRLITRPMKGTMPRGRWLEEDEEMARRLADSTKDIAENLMIVDLLRNDLGKVSVMGSVQVPRLFEVSRYETLWQMTSTIESVCRPQTALTDLFSALFPCGSITGAPKVRTSEIIREIEPFPRGIYTGTIGLVEPGGDATFNIAIRTISVNALSGLATYGIGSGVTADSTSESEYNECLLKASFLKRQARSFQLIETMLLENGDYFLLERHLARLKSSASYFGFMFDEKSVQARLDQIRGQNIDGQYKVRMLLDRSGQLQTEVQRLSLEDTVMRLVAFASAPVDSQNAFLYHKTTRRDFYEKALKDRPDCDDLIFCNERGEVTESIFANVVLISGKEKWTPSRSSGLLAGTFRDELIARGEIRERVIHREDVMQADALFLINSVRKWMPTKLVI